MSVFMIFLLLGGLGMFLYGMKMMSDGLENVAGDRMRRVLEVLTTDRFRAVAVGAGVTALVQSSSATTVMVVGFVNAGLMTLLQATGVIMGANIGTTITAQLIAFKLSDIAPFILFSGMLMTVFIKKRRIVKIGEIVLGFGILFVGLSLMSQAMEPLQGNESFRNFLVNFKNPVLGVLIGAVFTAVIQSSSASVGIMQALAISGLIGLDAAVFIVLGQNIGTCVTAIISAIGTTAKTCRRHTFDVQHYRHDNIFDTHRYISRHSRYRRVHIPGECIQADSQLPYIVQYYCDHTAVPLCQPVGESDQTDHTGEENR
jgi:phosphate:Na+ symporter